MALRFPGAVSSLRILAPEPVARHRARGDRDGGMARRPWLGHPFPSPRTGVPDTSVMGERGQGLAGPAQPWLAAGEPGRVTLNALAAQRHVNLCSAVLLRAGSPPGRRAGGVI